MKRWELHIEGIGKDGKPAYYDALIDAPNVKLTMTIALDLFLRDLDWRDTIHTIKLSVQPQTALANS